jgi:FkbM family methyltransferase
VGEYTGILQKLFPQSTIYAFEIIPATFELLRARVGELHGVVPVNLGLADEAGEVPIKYYKDCNVLSTMSDFPHNFDYETIQAKTTTGDLFCAEHGIDEIAFLKIDVEGMEHRVLQGLTKSLTARKVKVVQFEYGYANALSRFMLRDYYALFASYGYRIGKIYPRRIEFKEFDVQDENFWGPNYVAVRDDLVDLQSALSA